MNHKVSQIKLSPEVVQQKIMSWCAYQERSHNEVRHKLVEFGMNAEEIESILANLIADNFLNEERFALALASGKFRIKHWGKIKIKAELKKHKVSEYCINKALNSIDKEEYTRVIEKVIEKKAKMIKGNDAQKKFYLVLNYLISRGFESDLVRENLGTLHEKKL